MRLVLRQEFPLGRFHATPWRINPFDDPHGEWPPSPWRLVWSVTARWYQWAREAEVELEISELERLQAALCSSTYALVSNSTRPALGVLADLESVDGKPVIVVQCHGRQSRLNANATGMRALISICASYERAWGPSFIAARSQRCDCRGQQA
jgi:hypothetical protein